MAAVKRVELGGLFERVGQTAKVLADRRRARRQRTRRRVAVEGAAAGHRALAADVQRGERIQLTALGDAGDHAVLLLHRRVGGGRLHAAEFERRALVFIEVGVRRRRFDGRRREVQRRACTHRTRRRRHRGSVFGHQRAGDAIIGAGPVDVVLHDFNERGLARADRPV